MKRDYHKIECPTCGALNCKEHCDNCGKKGSIKQDPYSEKWHYYLDGQDYPHTGCMKENGTRDGKYHNRNNKDPDVYQIEDFKLERQGQSPVFKCDYCGYRGDLPLAKEHHKWEGFKHMIMKWEEAMKSKPLIIIDTKNQKLESFL